MMYEQKMVKRHEMMTGRKLLKLSPEAKVLKIEDIVNSNKMLVTYETLEWVAKEA